MGSIAAVMGGLLVGTVHAAVVPTSLVITFQVSDPDPNNHKEGFRYCSVAGPNCTQWTSLRNQVATFTDDNACTALDVCNAGSDYTVKIGWGDNSIQTFSAACGSVPASVCLVPLSQQGNQATYDILASHTYSDENNCLPSVTDPTCGFPLHIGVTNKLNNLTSDPSLGNSRITVQDLLTDAKPFSFTATDNTPFSKQVGAFHDRNYLSGANDPTEFSVVINWGDGFVDPNSGTVTKDVLGCGTVSGVLSGQGCEMDVNGDHTYLHFGQYTVTITIQDGLNPQPPITSTAIVSESRFGGTQAPPGTPGNRATTQSPAHAGGPRTAHFQPAARARIASSTSTSSAPARTQSIDVNWFDAIVQLLMGPASFQRILR